MNNAIRLLIFDWDGTLVDSLARIVEAMQAAATQCQLAPQTTDAIHAIIGLSLEKAFERLYPDHPDNGLQQRFKTAYSEYYLTLEQTPSAFYPGVRDALENFKQEGYQLAVATGKSRRGLDRVLGGHQLLDFFDITRCADETRSKPHPLMLEQILTHCQKTPEQAIMVGDSTFDLQMANRAQVAPIAVSYGAQPLSVLQAEQPVVSLEHFSELSHWLKQ